MYARLKKTVQLFICLYICRAATGKRQTEPFASIKIVELKERKQYKRSFFFWYCLEIFKPGLDFDAEQLLNQLLFEMPQMFVKNVSVFEF